MKARVHTSTSTTRLRRLGPAGIALVLLALGTVMLGGTGSGIAQTPGTADLSLSKADNPDPVTTNGALQYLITVNNAGPDDATGVVVTDTLPNSVNFISATPSRGSCSRKGHTVTCNIGTISGTAGTAANVSPVTVDIRVTAPNKAGTISNTATVSSNTPDPNAGNNADTEPTKVVQPGGAYTSPTCAGRAVTILGNAGDNLLVGSNKRDVVLARGGNDIVRSFGGHDVICANAGFDKVKAGTQGDLVKGGGGGDLLVGQAGNDVLRGQRGRDRLRGSRGADLLAGGRGNDRCNGGPGRDTQRSC